INSSRSAKLRALRRCPLRVQRNEYAGWRAQCHRGARAANQLFKTLHLDALVQRRWKIPAKIAHSRSGRAERARSGGSRVCPQGDGRTRDQCSLLRRRAVPAIWAASCGNLSAGRAPPAFPVTGRALATSVARFAQATGSNCSRTYGPASSAKVFPEYEPAAERRLFLVRLASKRSRTYAPASSAKVFPKYEPAAERRPSVVKLAPANAAIPKSQCPTSLVRLALEALAHSGRKVGSRQRL